MLDFARAKPNAVRIAVLAACLLTFFLFVLPIGLGSSSKADIAEAPPAVAHIVMFHFKRDAQPHAVNAACDRMVALKDDCVSPTSKSAYIQSITGGKDNSKEGLQNGATHAFVVRFANTEDRDYYVEHDPAHLAFKEVIAPIVEKAIVVDFTEGKYQ